MLWFRVPLAAQIVLASALGFAGTAAVTSPSAVRAIANSMLTRVTAGRVTMHGTCNIKGNVSATTGERIYHVPGQKYYSATRISPQYGDRWFCTEQQARAAGWRKSGV